MRLSGAGLGCPDWPGCYGQAIISDSADFKARAMQAFPDKPLDTGKAWKEMSHRYLASVLGIMILLLALTSWREKHCRAAAVAATAGLVFIVALQAALGMWAVKMQVMPIVVTGHLVLGMVTFWLLFWLYLRVNPEIVSIKPKPGLGVFANVAMLILFLQIVLGGWVSSNYAALACTGFPKCNGSWWPEADYQTALNIFNGLFTGYTGVISFAAQVAAHSLHRVGALVCFVLLSALMLSATSAHAPKSQRRAGLWLSMLLFIQISLGIISVKLGMPLWSGVAHNAARCIINAAFDCDQVL